MEGCLRFRKLALWHTRTFKPIMTHDELEPILDTLGFVAIPVSSSSSSSSPARLSSPARSSSPANNIAWKEYVFSAAEVCRNWSPTETLPLLRLPYPRIDGLHTCTYRAFIDAVTFYLGKSDYDISDLFHVRGVPLHRVYDKPFEIQIRPLEEDEEEKGFYVVREEGFYVFREDTLDPATFMLYKDNNSNDSSNNNNSNIFISNRANNPHISNLVPLKDIISSPIHEDFCIPASSKGFDS